MKIVTANNSSPVRLRKEPNGQIITTIPQGTVVDVISTQKDWSEIQVNGITGYMMSKFLTDKKENKSLEELKTKLKEVLQILDTLED
jgi:uncharacterized protein YgiM (DUF1202 family)